MVDNDVKKKKILLVDDDEIHLTISEAILGEKYEIVATRSGEEALRYLLHNPAPNLILLDILMPNMDGWETYNRLRAISLLQNVSVAFVSSITEIKEKNYAYKIGAVDFIMKPVKKEDLLERVGKILGDGGGIS